MDEQDPLIEIISQFASLDTDRMSHAIEQIRTAVAKPLENYLGDDFRIAERIIRDGR